MSIDFDVFVSRRQGYCPSILYVPKALREEKTGKLAHMISIAGKMSSTNETSLPLPTIHIPLV